MNLVKITSILATLVVFSGCASLGKRNVSRSNGQTDPKTDQAAIEAGQIQKLLSSVAQTPDKGYHVKSSGNDLARLPDGTPVYITVQTPAGPIQTPVRVSWSEEATLNSYVELAGLEGVELNVGKIRDLTGAMQYSSVPHRDFLHLKVDKAASSSQSAEALGKLADGRARHTEVAGQALTEAITAKWKGTALVIGASVELVKQGGQTAVGIIQAVNPIAGAVGLAKVVLEDGTTETVEVEQ